LLIKLALCC